ncbi:hypothetical protein C479_08318 [Halovivax asiaticus JCM 14624]|uniref:Uncharacterized protein n=1 Tax=Halovivax asiaticus JCM 14624 TaxID=1227490 RepID=M0BIS5_9EURY|nr:hypothetical protein [Halovivax asiaticus]ELZ10801.1 hypothetical protein C479_08318 [Halovivax asiaticus JCM 14624]
MEPRETDDSQGRRRTDPATESGTPTHRRSVGWAAVTIDLVVVLCGIAVALVGIPLVVGYTLVLGTVPPTDSVAFYGLVSAVMLPGPLMGAMGCWLAARSDPA